MEEVPNPNQNKDIVKNPNLPKSKSILGITFTEGEEYENWFGTYRVLKIIDDILIKEDGTVTHNILRVRKNIKSPKDGEHLRILGKFREWPSIDIFKQWRKRHLKLR
jgi:hypothetical protein